MWIKWIQMTNVKVQISNECQMSNIKCPKPKTNNHENTKFRKHESRINLNWNPIIISCFSDFRLSWSFIHFSFCSLITCPERPFVKDNFHNRHRRTVPFFFWGIGILDFIWHLDFVICLSSHSLPAISGLAKAEALLHHSFKITILPA